MSFKSLNFLNFEELGEKFKAIKQMFDKVEIDLRSDKSVRVVSALKKPIVAGELVLKVSDKAGASVANESELFISVPSADDKNIYEWKEINLT